MGKQARRICFRQSVKSSASNGLELSTSGKCCEHQALSICASGGGEEPFSQSCGPHTLSGQHLGEGSFQLQGVILDAAMKDLHGLSAGDAGMSASTLGVRTLGAAPQLRQAEEGLSRQNEVAWRCRC